MITHAPATQLNEPRPGAYSINGILGLQHDPNGNSIKRKRIDDHGEYKPIHNTNYFIHKHLYYSIYIAQSLVRHSL